MQKTILELACLSSAGCSGQWPLFAFVVLPAAYVFIIALNSFLKRYFKSWSIIRRFFLRELYDLSRFPFLQVIQSPEGLRRYSILYFKWNRKERRYDLQGFQYDTEGRDTAKFESQSVRAPQAPDDGNLNFVWKASLADSYEHFGGYTHMAIELMNRRQFVGGDGFFVTFDVVPRRYALRFRRLSKQQLQRLGWTGSVPHTPFERAEFVKTVHNAAPAEIDTPFLAADEVDQTVMSDLVPLRPDVRLRRQETHLAA